MDRMRLGVCLAAACLLLALAAQAQETAPALAPTIAAPASPPPAPVAAEATPSPPYYPPKPSAAEWFRWLPEDPMLLAGVIISFISAIGFLFVIWTVFFELIVGPFCMTFVDQLSKRK